MGRRYYCDVAGLEENWVEVDERWTYGEVTRYLDVREPDDERRWWARKLTACRIMVGEVVIDSPSALASCDLEEMDLRLYGFLLGILSRAIRDLRTLGNLSGRLSSPSDAAWNEQKAMVPAAQM